MFYYRIKKNFCTELSNKASLVSMNDKYWLVVDKEEEEVINAMLGFEIARWPKVGMM